MVTGLTPGEITYIATRINIYALKLTQRRVQSTTQDLTSKSTPKGLVITNRSL
jgi:hypothetical protein